MSSSIPLASASRIRRSPPACDQLHTAVLLCHVEVDVQASETRLKLLPLLLHALFKTGQVVSPDVLPLGLAGCQVALEERGVAILFYGGGGFCVGRGGPRRPRPRARDPGAARFAGETAIDPGPFAELLFVLQPVPPLAKSVETALEGGEPVSVRGRLRLQGIEPANGRLHELAGFDRRPRRGAVQ